MVGKNANGIIKTQNTLKRGLDLATITLFLEDFLRILIGSSSHYERGSDEIEILTNDTYLTLVIG